MITTVMFDLNGVFIQSPKLSDRFRDDFSVPPEQFLPALQDVLNKVRMPNAGDMFLFWKPYFDVWGVTMTRDQLFAYWFGAECEVPEMVALARELKDQGLRLFILSNNLRERATYYAERLSWLQELFAHVYYSWETGLVKPDIRVYECILHEHGLTPNECVYFDDSEKNVEVASSLGIHAYLFEGVDATRSAIAEARRKG